MATVNISPDVIAALQVYPLLVTGQLVPDRETPRPSHPSARVDGTDHAARRRPFARLHHTSRYGVR